MKKLEELTPEELKKAQENEYLEALKTLIQIPSENFPEIQENIDRAWDAMEEMRTPWFIVERLLEDPEIVNFLKEWVEDIIKRPTTFFKEKEDIVIKLQ